MRSSSSLLLILSRRSFLLPFLPDQWQVLAFFSPKMISIGLLVSVFFDGHIALEFSSGAPLRHPSCGGLCFCLLDKAHRFFRQITDHGFYISSDIADFRILCRFHFYKRCIGKGSNPSCDFRLAYAGRPDQENIFRADFAISGESLLARQRFLKATATGFLGILLADDVLIQIFYNTSWR